MDLSFEKKFEKFCGICAKYVNSRPSLDDKDYIVNFEKQLIIIDLGFKSCPGQCVPACFSDNIVRFDPDNVNIMDIVRINKGFSFTKGKCSIVFKVCVFDQLYLMEAYNYRHIRDEECPCKHVLENSYRIGQLKISDLALPVNAFIWNEKARVLWIFEPWCPAPPTIEVDSWKYQMCIMIERFLERIYRRPSIDDGKSDDKHDGGDEAVEGDEVRPVRRSSPSKSSGLVEELSDSFKRLRFNEKHFYRGTFVFRQRLMEQECVLTEPYVSVRLNPKLRDFWNVNGEFCYFMHKDIFLTRFNLPNLYTKINVALSKYGHLYDGLKSRFGVTFDGTPDSVWNIFMKILIPPENEPDIILLENFFNTVILMGIWWEDPTALTGVVLNFFTRPKDKWNVDAGQRQFIFRPCQSGPYLVAQFYPHVTIDGMRVSKLKIGYDVAANNFFIEDGWDIHSENPVYCLTDFLKVTSPPVPGSTDIKLTITPEDEESPGDSYHKI